MEGGAAVQPGVGWLPATTAMWAVAYIVVRALLPARSKDFANRCVSLLHVVVSLYFCSRSVKNWSRPLDGVGGPSTYAQMLALTVSLAYFIYDSICCFIELPYDLEYTIHHILSLMGLGFGYMRGSSGTELVACLMLMEVSNPCMHGREIFKELKLKDTQMNFMNDVAFALVFSFARMIVGPYVVYTTLQAPNSPIGVKAGALGIQVVSAFWFWKIARMITYKLKKAKTKKAE